LFLSGFAYVTKSVPLMFWMPNGAKRLGIFLSTNAPVGVTRLKLPSKTSTRALWKSVA